MPREPKQKAEDHLEGNKGNPANEEVAVSRQGDYYYDDAHGYEDYDPTEESDENESDD